MKVFLGGTVNDSKWRDSVIPHLKIEYFNPVVSEWNDLAYFRELEERSTCDFCLYVITPRMEGFYSIAEVADDSYKRPDKTIYCYLNEDNGTKFSSKQIQSLKLIGKRIVSNGGMWFNSLADVINYLNSITAK